MSKPVTKKERRAMFAAWQEVQSINYVSRKTGRSDSAVKRWRKLDKWDERLAAIQEQARQLSDSTDASRLAGIIADLGDIRQGLVAQLKKLAKEGNLPATLADLDRLIRLEQFLLGFPDSRAETIDPIQALIRRMEAYDEGSLNQ